MTERKSVEAYIFLISPSIVEVAEIILKSEIVAYTSRAFRAVVSATGEACLIYSFSPFSEFVTFVYSSSHADLQSA